MAVVLVLPLLLFLVFTYIVPLADILFYSVDNTPLAKHMPRAAAALSEWDGLALPDDDMFNTVGEDLARAYRNHSIGQVANHINHKLSGMRSFLIRTARRLAKSEDTPHRSAMIAIDERWGKRETWAALKDAAPRLTADNYLTALDLRAADGEIVRQPEDKRIYLKIFWRTLWVSFVVTLICLLLGFPVAYLMASLPLRISNWLMIMVLLPFWTSLLVRAVSWIVLLQSSGVLNSILVWSGLIDDSERVRLIFNLTGTVIVMSYVLLPFMVLPLYSVMKTIPKTVARVAISLGAHPVTAFYRAYLPQAAPGIAAGSLLVFMLAAGYYITPALVGGQSGQLISNFIVYHIKTSLNWGLAAAIGIILLLVVLLAYRIYNKVAGVGKVKMI